MPIESANYISQLDQTSPKGTEKFSTIAAHARITKKAFYQSFPNMSSECSATAGELNSVVGMTQTVLSAMASLSATLNATLLDVGETATAANRWGSSEKYVQTATPSVADNAFWFRTD